MTREYQGRNARGGRSTVGSATGHAAPTAGPMQRWRRTCCRSPTRQSGTCRRRSARRMRAGYSAMGSHSFTRRFRRGLRAQASGLARSGSGSSTVAASGLPRKRTAWHRKWPGHHRVRLGPRPALQQAGRLQNWCVLLALDELDA